jgi:hypothetical protein
MVRALLYYKDSVLHFISITYVHIIYNICTQILTTFSHHTVSHFDLKYCFHFDVKQKIIFKNTNTEKILLHSMLIDFCS